MVFESRTACLGYQRIFQFTGAEFLTDIRGRKMGRLSKETRFFTMLAAGISKFYPMFLGKNDLISFQLKAYSELQSFS